MKKNQAPKIQTLNDYMNSQSQFYNNQNLQSQYDYQKTQLNNNYNQSEQQLNNNYNQSVQQLNNNYNQSVQQPYVGSQNYNNTYYNQQQTYNNQYSEEDSEIYNTNNGLSKKIFNGVIIFLILSVLYFSFKDTVLFAVFKIELTRQSFMFSLIFLLFLTLISFILSIWLKFEDKGKKYFTGNLIVLYISAFLLLESVYLLLIFYFGK